MIYGIGTDLCQISRFKDKIEDIKFLNRFFNEKEIKSFSSEEKACEYYASRFAAKEAFAKALGTGLRDMELKHICVVNNQLGKPELIVTQTAQVQLLKMVKHPKIHISLSHEQDYAQAFVVIEE